jgi:hypothetical protein
MKRKFTMRAYIMTAIAGALLSTIALGSASAAAMQKAAPVAAAKAPAIKTSAHSLLSSLDREGKRIEADTRKGSLNAQEARIVQDRESSIRNEIHQAMTAGKGKLTAKQIAHFRAEIASLNNEVHKLATNSTRA